MHAKLDECITCMAAAEKELFLNFITKMLQSLPEERKTAKELREDPWLQSGVWLRTPSTKLQPNISG
jgi:serine/threonine protein kinase